MTSFIKFLALAVGTAIIALTVRSAHREMGAVFSIAAGIVLLLVLLDKLGEVVAVLRDMAQYAQLEDVQVGVILKVLGVSFLTEFAAQACRDAGEAGVAMRVELGGKVLLVLISLPLVKEIVEIILELTG